MELLFAMYYEVNQEAINQSSSLGFTGVICFIKQKGNGSQAGYWTRGGAWGNVLLLRRIRESISESRLKSFATEKTSKHAQMQTGWLICIFSSRDCMKE